MNTFKGRLKGLMIPSCIAHFEANCFSIVVLKQQGSLLSSSFSEIFNRNLQNQFSDIAHRLRVPKTIVETIIDLNGRSYISFYCDSQDNLSTIALSLY